MQNRVTLHEGAALHILPAHTHIGAFQQDRTKCKQLTHTPVHLTALTHFDALLQKLLQLLVHGKAIGYVTK